MPFRRKSKLLDQIAEKVREKGGAGVGFSSVTTLATIELLIERVWALMRIVAFVVAVVSVVVIGLVWQATSSSHRIDQVKDVVSTADDSARRADRSAKEAAQAAKDAKTALDAAIASANNPDAARATADAVAAIFRIEHAVCGGPCPN